MKFVHVYCCSTIFSFNESLLLQVSEELGKWTREDELRDAVFLILCNKQDLPNAMKPVEVTERMNLPEILRNNKWYVQPTIAVDTTDPGLLPSIHQQRSIL